MASHPPLPAPPRSPPSRPPRQPGLASRLARSSRVFLLGLIVACGVEVLVDWNATLYEVNVLRDDLRQRGLSYVAILARAALPALRAGEGETLRRLSVGVVDDADVIFVRFADRRGQSRYEHLRPAYGAEFQRQRGQDLTAYYAAQLSRDTRGAISDPAGLAARMAHSRHRDFVQAWNDAMARAAQLFSAPPPPLPPGGLVLLYQDRLRDHAGQHDGAVTYALGVVRGDEAGAPAEGVVIIAFSTARTQSAILKKYLKGLGMVVFFVGLILVQNVLSRRDKLRLLALEERQAQAKHAILEALPGPLRAPPLHVSAGLLQAEGPVDGVVYALHADEDELAALVVDPDGEGIPAAATALHLLNEFHARRAGGGALVLEDELRALGAAALRIPLSRPVGLCLLVVQRESGLLRGVSGPLGGCRLIGEAGVTRLEEAPLAADAPPGIIGPLRALAGQLQPGVMLATVFAGLTRRDRGASDAWSDAVADYLRRRRSDRRREPEELASDAAAWARGRSAGLTESDVLVLLIACAAAAPR